MVDVETTLAKERDANEYYNTGLYDVSSSKLGDLAWCEGMVEDKWLKGMGMDSNKKLRMGKRTHSVYFWFYDTLASGSENALKTLAKYAREKDDEGIYIIFKSIMNQLLPKDYPREDLNRIKFFLKHEINRLLELTSFLGTMDVVSLRTYFIPIMFEESFLIKMTDEELEADDDPWHAGHRKHGTVDAAFQAPPGYKFNKKNIRYIIWDFKSQVSNDVIKQVKENEKKRPHERKKLTMPSRYRRQFSFYNDYLSLKCEVDREEILHYLLMFNDDGYIAIPELPKNKTFTSRDELTRKWRQKIEAYKTDKSVYVRKPFHKKCNRCSNAENCLAWKNQKAPFQVFMGENKSD